MCAASCSTGPAVIQVRRSQHLFCLERRLHTLNAAEASRLFAGVADPTSLARGGDNESGSRARDGKAGTNGLPCPILLRFIVWVLGVCNQAQQFPRRGREGK